MGDDNASVGTSARIDLLLQHVVRKANGNGLAVPLKAVDGTEYRRMEDGSLRRVGMKINGKQSRKIRKRLRDQNRGQR